ncbi:DUF4352 domain-containing protein [Jiangella sp. DSM 45060]|uniref:DUF4352 domain-containing protein n=1 Tax=Jiangella sp. DSM 45060 TaxID=1798224 RepID=UPI00087B4199|nr:DUF4352 domain-containing protein [Jiangella sp. DSM 45060]SDT38176.1 Protein of unknown function [Jiangella sp. DSM 45060]
MNEQHTPEGWYQDGQDPTVDRWWDGTRWTGATRPRVAPGAPPVGQPATVVVAPEPPKKRHRVRNAFLLVVGVIVLIMIIQAATGGDDETPATASQEDGGEAEGDAGPGIGDPAEDGDFTFVVESVEDGPERIGTDAFGTSPQGRFVYVTITVTNHGDEASSFFGDNQYLVDTEGRKASADTEAALYLPESQSLYEEINPGNTLTGTVVFDIPADAVPAAVELHDSLFSGGVTVGLS